MFQRIDLELCPGGNNGRRWLMDKENKRDTIDPETTSDRQLKK